MPATVDFQVVGLSRSRQAELRNAIVTATARTPGRWRVQFIGEREDDIWELRVSGPGVETSHYLDNAKGEHDAAVIAAAVLAITRS